MSPRRPFAALMSAAVLAALVGPAAAGPLDPNAFTSLGPFPTAPGTYTFNTSGTPTLTGPGGTFTGVVFGNTAVFTFDSVTVGSGITLVGGAGGSRPLALLSHGGVAVTGTGQITVSGAAGGNTGADGRGGTGGAGGPGGFAGGPGGPPGSPGNAGGPGSGPGGGGGGPVGPTGAGGSGGGFGGRGGGPAGGSPYGNLYDTLIGGSGGGGGAGGLLIGTFGGGGGGGGGGGVIEIGAVGPVVIGGSIRVAGGAGGSSPGSLNSNGGGAGGAGGGIVLYGHTVEIAGLLDAGGGAGGGGGGPTSHRHGAGGGGGRVLIGYGPGGFTNTGVIDVSGGAGMFDAPGGLPGVVVFTPIPEPAGVGAVVAGLAVLLSRGRFSGWRGAGP
jgi:hypothetical protein